jgi:EmrB/QacA subfamily drug resistance transporter
LSKVPRDPDRLDPLVWKITSVAVMGPFLSLLDVVNVSLSTLAVELHSSLTTIQWATSGYLLALALMLPLNGWLVERIGAKSLYLWCFSAFTLCSALCGIAWSANALIGFRILQGMCGGLMAPMMQMMMARVAGRHMARVLGYAALPVILAPILGPVIAGAILQHASWRWLFLVNLPVGALAIVLAIFFLPNDREETKQRDLDLVGFALLSPGLVLFLYGSDHMGERIGQITLALSVMLLAMFFKLAVRKGNRALIDLQLFKGRTFRCLYGHPIYVERSLVCGSDADSDLSDPRVWPLPQCDRLAIGSSWRRDDLFLSVDRSADAALWDSQGICRRSISSSRRDATIHLARQSRI